MKAIIVACVLLEHEQKYLLIQQDRSRRQPGKWGPPGGKPEHSQGETLFAAAIRETFEEIGCQVALTGFVGIVRSGHLEEPNLFVCFAGRLQDEADATKLKLRAGEISDGRWFSLEEIENGNIPLRAKPFATIFRRFQNGQIYPLGVLQHEALDPTE
jgi:8-oxo-dGTP pyrophosphatase MutT (NUDIX family)